MMKELDKTPYVLSESTYPVVAIKRIVDGDTYYFQVDLGFSIYTIVKVRLLGYNTPEIRGSERPQGLLAKAFVTDLLMAAKHINIKVSRNRGNLRQGKYGRYLAEVECQLPGGVPQDLGDALFDANLATIYKGGA